LERAAAAVNAAGPQARPTSLADAFAGVLRATGEPGPLTGIERREDAIAEVLAELYAIFAAPDAADAARRLNAGLARHTAALRLVEEPGAAWHLHAERPGDDSWAGWFAATSLVALAVHFASHGAPAWGVCAARGCRHVYARSGPGRPRTTCSAGCATKKRQAELRARRRASTVPPDAIPGGADPRGQAGVRAGDTLDVELRLDTEPRELAAPPDLAAALDPHPEARRFFDGLTASQKRVFVDPIEQAKKPETRQARVEKAVAALRDGRKRP
jgi:hypothetical protein